MAGITGGQLTAEALIRRGRDDFYLERGTYHSDLPISGGLPHQLFDTRHEQAAVFMAEAFGRMTGKPGTAMVTAGPGFYQCPDGSGQRPIGQFPSGPDFRVRGD